MKPEAFLARHRLFTRAEFTEYLLGRGRTESTAATHLARWLGQGRIVRVKQGVYVRMDGEIPDAPPDFVAIASRMAPDAAVSHHTALEALGHAQSAFERFTFVTWTKTKPASFQGRRFVPVRPRAALLRADRGERWIERAPRADVEIRVTNVERTVADVLDRLDLAGGLEEVWRSLLSVPALDASSLEEYVSLLGNRTLAAKVGYFLEVRREELVVPPRVLDRLRTQVPRSPVYFDRQARGTLVPGWSLILPTMLAPGDEE